MAVKEQSNDGKGENLRCGEPWTLTLKLVVLKIVSRRSKRRVAQSRLFVNL